MMARRDGTLCSMKSALRVMWSGLVTEICVYGVFRTGIHRGDRVVLTPVKVEGRLQPN